MKDVNHEDSNGQPLSVSKKGYWGSIFKGRFIMVFIAGIVLGFIFSKLTPPIYQMDNKLRGINYIVRHIYQNLSVSDAFKNYEGIVSSRFPYESTQNCVYERNKDGRLSGMMLKLLFRECRNEEKEYYKLHKEIKNGWCFLKGCKLRDLEIDILVNR
mgnify:CR=1 FL=1